MFQRGPNCTYWQVLLFPVPLLLSLNPRLQGKPRRCSEGWRIGKAVEGKPCFHGKRSETFEGSHSSPSICTWLQLRAVVLSASPALSVTCSNSCSESSSHSSDFYWRCFSIVVCRMLPSFLFLRVSFLLNNLFVINLWYVRLLRRWQIQF